MKATPRAIVAQASIVLSAVNTEVLNQLWHSAHENSWMYKEDRLSSTEAQELKLLLVKMELIVDQARHAMGFLEQDAEI
jgi:hypothetical protein